MAENKGPILLAVTILCYCLAFAGTAARIYVRKCIINLLGWDDYLIIAALLFYTMYISFVITGIAYGTGQHHSDLSNSDIVTAVKYWYFCEWAYVMTMTILKTGIGIFYLRIMVERWQKLVVQVVTATVVVFGASYFACVVAQCVPVPHIWNRFSTTMESQGGCLPEGIVLGGTYLHSIISAGSDWILACMPVAMLWNVKLGTSIRTMVWFILLLGALASTATLVRISVIRHIKEMVDFLWVTFDIAVWSTVEPGVGLFACGLAALRPLLRKLFPARFGHANIVSTVVELPPCAVKTDNTTVSTVLSGSRVEEEPKPRLELEITDNNRKLVESKDFSQETSWFISGSVKGSVAGTSRGGGDSCVSSKSREVPVVFKQSMVDTRMDDGNWV